MKKLVFLFLALLNCQFNFGQTILGNGRALFVENFGLTIFRIDEFNNPPTTFTRQNDLITYCQNHSITTLILYRMNRVPNTILKKNLLITSPNAQEAIIQARLAAFIVQAHNAGITTVAAAGSPDQSFNTASLFFDNVNQYNKRVKASYGNETPCFDMIYVESDWWYGDGSATEDPDDAWTNHFRPGMIAVHNEVVTSQGSSQYKSLVSGTYIGNLANLIYSSNQNLANELDANIDIIYDHLYFPGYVKSGSNNDITDVNPFFASDKSNGRRLECFSLI